MDSCRCFFVKNYNNSNDKPWKSRRILRVKPKNRKYSKILHVHFFILHLSYDTCVLRLIRVRAQPFARMCVSRVHVTFHGTAYAFFSGPSHNRLVLRTSLQFTPEELKNSVWYLFFIFFIFPFSFFLF